MGDPEERWAERDRLLKLKHGDPEAMKGWKRWWAGVGDDLLTEPPKEEKCER